MKLSDPIEPIGGFIILYIQTITCSEMLLAHKVIRELEGLFLFDCSSPVIYLMVLSVCDVGAVRCQFFFFRSESRNTISMFPWFQPRHGIGSNESGS